MKSYYVLKKPLKYEENLTKAGLPIYSTEEFNRYKGEDLLARHLAEPPRGIQASAWNLQSICEVEQVLWFR